MDWNRVEGNWKQVKGKVKEQWGKLTDDDLDVINGKQDQLRRQAATTVWLRQGPGCKGSERLVRPPEMVIWIKQARAREARASLDWRCVPK